MRRALREHERWAPERLERHRQAASSALRAYAYANSPFYARFHRGLTDRPLAELPVLTKRQLMEHFDELVTDRRVRLAGVEAHLATLTGDARFLDRYRVVATSGSTGVRDIFLSDPAEWATVMPPTTAPRSGRAYRSARSGGCSWRSSARRRHGTSRRAWARASGIPSFEPCGSTRRIRSRTSSNS